MATVANMDALRRRDPIDLSGAHLPGMDLSHANLEGSTFAGANLSNMNFEGADLRDADFTGANLSGADLTGADLTRANLRNADLKSVVLTAAKLRGTNLDSADLSDAHLKGQDLSEVVGLTWGHLLDAEFDENTIPPAYLKESDIVRLLEQTAPEGKWQEELSATKSDIMAALVILKSKLGGGSLLTRLRLVQVELEMREESERPND